MSLVFAIMAGVFVIETLSVAIQVISFKTRGKRVFLMAPIHHHYELKRLARAKNHCAFLDYYSCVDFNSIGNPKAKIKLSMKSLIYGYGITGKSFERYLKEEKY